MDGESPAERLRKVGEVARQTGLTVRTLHHWEAVGLLTPARRSPAGYRLYDRDDLVRLHQIVSLRQLNFSLEEIRESLARPGLTLPRVVRAHLDAVRRQIEGQRRLLRRLEAVAERAERSEGLSAEELLTTMELIVAVDRHYTREQMDRLAARRSAVREDEIRAAEEEWPRLIAAVRAEMERGADPGSETVQRLARRWRELVEAFTGGDPELAAAACRMVREEPGLRERTGIDRDMAEYVARATRSRGGE